MGCLDAVGYCLFLWAWWFPLLWGFPCSMRL